MCVPAFDTMFSFVCFFAQAVGWLMLELLCFLFLRRYIKWCLGRYACLILSYYVGWNKGHFYLHYSEQYLFYWTRTLFRTIFILLDSYIIQNNIYSIGLVHYSEQYLFYWTRTLFGTVFILLDSYTAAKPISDSVRTSYNIDLTAVYSFKRIQYCTLQ
jgi:hypothetical protein